MSMLAIALGARFALPRPPAHCITTHKLPWTSIDEPGAELDTAAVDSAVLAHLREAGPQAITSTADYLEIGRSRVSKSIFRLISRGLVEKSASTVVLNFHHVHLYKAASSAEPAKEAA